MNNSADVSYVAVDDKNSGIHPKNAVNALYFGIAALFGWIIPFLGIPLSLVAVLLGANGLNSSRKDMARSGISLGIIGLVLSGTYMLVIYYLISSGFIEGLLELL